MGWRSFGLGDSDDCENDSNEEKNLAAIAEFQSVVTEMRGLLRRIVKPESSD